MWTVYANAYEAGELSNTSVFQRIKFHGEIAVKAIRIWVVMVGPPVLQGLRMKIYNKNVSADLPGTVLATSLNSYDASEIILTETSGVKEIYFEFNDVVVKDGDEYFLVLNADTYTPSGVNQFAWRNVWPDPSYTTNYTVTGNNFLSSPLFVSAVIGARL